MWKTSIISLQEMFSYLLLVLSYLITSDTEHQKIDYEGIHSKLCPFLPSLRGAPRAVKSDEERLERERRLHQLQLELLEICTTETKKNLFQSQFSLAIPAALQSLRFAMQIYGKDAVDLVPSYLLLAESSIGLNHFAQAEDYLSMAKWAVMKSSRKEYAIQAQLSRSLGQLYLSQNKIDQALVQFSEDVYFSFIIGILPIIDLWTKSY